MRGNKFMGFLWIIIAVFLTAILFWKLNDTPSRKFHGINIANGNVSVNINQAPLLETKTFDASQFSAIDANLSFESLFIEKSNSSQVVVEIYSSADYAPTVEIYENTLKVKSTKLPKPVFESRKIVIKLPDNIDINDCDLYSASGSIHISDLDADTIDAQSASGSVHFTNGNYSTLDAKSSSGSVHLTNCTADKADINSTSGSVHITDCEFEELEGRSTSGSVHFEGKAEQIDLQSVSGSVHAQLANALKDNSLIHSTSGSVYVSVPKNSGLNVQYSAISGTYRNSITGSKGKKGSEVMNGGGPKLELQTTSGSIHLDAN